MYYTLSIERLEFAKNLVPEVKTYKVNTKLSPQEDAKEVRSIFGDQESNFPPVILECAGVESSIITCAYVTRRSGTLMVIGVEKILLITFHS